MEGEDIYKISFYQTKDQWDALTDWSVNNPNKPSWIAMHHHGDDKEDYFDFVSSLTNSKESEEEKHALLAEIPDQEVYKVTIFLTNDQWNRLSGWTADIAPKKAWLQMHNHGVSNDDFKSFLADQHAWYEKQKVENREIPVQPEAETNAPVQDASVATAQ